MPCNSMPFQEVVAMHIPVTPAGLLFTIGNVEWKPGKGRQTTTQSDLHVGVA